RPLCGALSYPLVGTAETSVTYTLALPSGCCISEEAFVLVRFLGSFGPCFHPQSGLTPSIYGSLGQCMACDQYYTAPPSVPTLTLWCPNAAGLMWMQVDADCCGPTEVGRQSWGTIKTLYR